jgi:hypothetical protein
MAMAINQTSLAATATFPFVVICSFAAVAGYHYNRSVRIALEYNVAPVAAISVILCNSVAGHRDIVLRTLGLQYDIRTVEIKRITMSPDYSINLTIIRKKLSKSCFGSVIVCKFQYHP